jgi:hypothetical protein
MISLLAGGPVRADGVRYYEQGGVTYCETRRTVEERVPQSRMQERNETVYREQLVTEMHDSVRTCWTPVTEYRWEAFWVGQWNPFVEPYLAYRYVPRTHWQKRTELVKVPVTTCRLVPETSTVRRPVAGWRVVRREVISRVAVNGGASGTPRGWVETPALARREVVGGIQKLESDPPRHGSRTVWRSAGGPVRR